MDVGSGSGVRDGSGGGDLGNRGGMRGVRYGGSVGVGERGRVRGIGDGGRVRGVSDGGRVRGVRDGGRVRGIGDGGSDGWRGDFSNRGGIGQRCSVGNRGGDLGYRGGVGKRSVCHWGGDLGQRSGIGERSSVRDGGGDLGDGGSIGEGCSWRNVSNGGSSDRSSGDGLDGDSSGFFADYSVESVDWVSGVVDSAFGTISLQQRVATLDEVTIAGLVLALGVTGLGDAGRSRRQQP